tara:strand:- start:702 stop:1865 length:1164 start_codon:yes stop_codon:yes gene_type:complete
MAVGSIPVLLADTLELPSDIDWDNTIVRVNENEYLKIPEILSNITPEKENEMRQNCIKVYDKLKNNFKNKKTVVHYCCGSYHKGDYGGVARFDYHISKVFPFRVHFTGPLEKNEMLQFLKYEKNVIVITDNHLACDIPNEYEVILVHHGVAQTHAEREPEWNEYWKNLCCNGQKQMLYHRDPTKTKIVSISQFCKDEFTRYYGNMYTRFENHLILNSSELDINVKKEKWNDKPVILGNWPCINKGSSVVEALSSKSSEFIFKKLDVKCNGITEKDIIDFNKCKQTIYIESDLYLSLSLCEGNSYALLDALLCGLPIVSTDTGMFYKDVPNDCFVKVEWQRRNDIEYIREKITYAIQNKKTLGNNAREWFLNNCNLDKWSNHIKQLII